MPTLGTRIKKKSNAVGKRPTVASDDGGCSGLERGLRLCPRLIKVAESLATRVPMESQQTDRAKTAAVKSKGSTILRKPGRI